MSVTEIATLKISSPRTWDSPDVRSFFETLSVQQAAWSGYPLRFFQDAHDAQVVYLITGWESVPAHHLWIASEENQTLLERAKGMLEVVGLEHAALDANQGDAPFVVWQQWAEGGDNEREADGKGTGPVLDKEGEICSLEGYVKEDEAYMRYTGATADPLKEGKETVLMKRLLH